MELRRRDVRSASFAKVGLAGDNRNYHIERRATHVSTGLQDKLYLSSDFEGASLRREIFITSKTIPLPTLRRS